MALGVKRAMGPASWICRACAHSSPSDVWYCENCGLDVDATEEEAEQQRIAYTRAPNAVRERARTDERKKQFRNVLDLLIVAAAVVLVFVLSWRYLL